MRSFNQEPQVFPIHDYTLVGVQNGTVIDDQHIGLVHCNEDTNVTIETSDGGSIVISGLSAGFDFKLPGNAGTLTTTGSVILS
ncbi:MAG: hypothetical protein B6U76_00170 [Desulfurococcales archaeon ex4484_217_2]|nr:MAG: hypothetical protein B6U76_00170 [Desulfurococcales archaeon ex4484_217_2]